MGKTKYAKASATVCAIPATSLGSVESMPIVPKASYHVASPKKKANQRTPDASAHICVYKVCSDAMIFKDDNDVCLFPGITSVRQSVFLVTLSHPNAYPQIDFKLLDKMDTMLQSSCDGSERPRNWEDLVQKLHIVAVNTGTFAPYNLPYKNWQRAFYVAGDKVTCSNFLMELDSCIVYTVEHTVTPKYGPFPLLVQLGVNVGIEVGADEFDYPLVQITHDVQLENMTVKPLEVYPPQGVRPLIIHFEVINDVEVAMTFFGDTYRHRHAFNNAGLERTKEEPAADSRAEARPSSSEFDRPKRLETFYLMTRKDISVETEAAFVRNLLTDVIENVIVDLRLISAAAEDTPTCTFVEALKHIPNLWFRQP